MPRARSACTSSALRWPAHPDRGRCSHLPRVSRRDRLRRLADRHAPAGGSRCHRGGALHPASPALALRHPAAVLRGVDAPQPVFCRSQSQRDPPGLRVDAGDGDLRRRRPGRRHRRRARVARRSRAGRHRVHPGARACHPATTVARRRLPARHWPFRFDRPGHPRARHRVERATRRRGTPRAQRPDAGRAWTCLHRGRNRRQPMGECPGRTRDRPEPGALHQRPRRIGPSPVPTVG